MLFRSIVEWGPQRFGAEAAARANFHKSAAALSTIEAARLAAILPNPRVWRASNPGPYVAGRANDIVGRMGQVTRDGLDACVRR